MGVDTWIFQAVTEFTVRQIEHSRLLYALSAMMESDGGLDRGAGANKEG